MTVLPRIRGEILDQALSNRNLLGYMRLIDPERFKFTEPMYTDLLAGLLRHFGYTKVGDLHGIIKKGWDRFLAYERGKSNPFAPLSVIMAIYYTLLIADSRVRDAIMCPSDYDASDLTKYFSG